MSSVIINCRCPVCGEYLDLNGIKVCVPESWQETCDNCKSVFQLSTAISLSARGTT